MGTELLSETDFAATHAAISCDRCGCRPSIEFTATAGEVRQVRVCVPCLGDVASALPAIYLEQLVNYIHGRVSEDIRGGPANG